MNAADAATLIAEARKTQGYSEGDLRSLVRNLADALQAATHKDSLMDRAVEVLDALPVGVVMLDKDSDAWQVTCETVDGTEIRYQCTDGSAYYTAQALLRHGPFRLVWNPAVS